MNEYNQITKDWATEMQSAINHCISAHEDYARQESDRYRFHDKITPYAVHPVWCAMTLLSESKLPYKTRRIGYFALLLHDTLEDTNLNLPEGLDAKTKDLIKELTFSSLGDEKRTIWNRSDIAILLKLYDKASNLLDGAWMSKDKWNDYVAYTLRLTEYVAEKFGNDLNVIKIARAIAIIK